MEGSIDVTQKLLHCQILIMQSWRKEIPEDQGNVIIATALNYCVYHEDLKIKGYLITRRRLFLMMIDKDHTIKHILNVFSEQLIKGIQGYKKMENAYHYEKTMETFELSRKLFKVYPFFNPYIKKLLIGEPINLPYYNPHVVRLEDQIHDYNFCSAIDYSGAKGPVILDYELY